MQKLVVMADTPSLDITTLFPAPQSIQKRPSDLFTAQYGYTAPLHTAPLHFARSAVIAAAVELLASFALYNTGALDPPSTHTHHLQRV